MYFMRQRGATFRLGREGRCRSATTTKGRVAASLESGKEVHGDALLYTVGRQTNADLLNLDGGGPLRRRARDASRSTSTSRPRCPTSTRPAT